MFSRLANDKIPKFQILQFKFVKSCIHPIPIATYSYVILDIEAKVWTYFMWLKTRLFHHREEFVKVFTYSHGVVQIL